MDIMSILAIALGVLASSIAVVAHLHLPVKEIEHYEAVTKAKVQELKREAALVEAARLKASL